MSKEKEKTTQVLFSCFGKSDPARGEHDGGLLHILRHHRPRPDAVMLFLTKEVVERDQKDNRIAKTWELMRTEWGYQPELIRHATEITDPSNLDLLDQPLREALQELVNLYPNADVLINLSSGTPQMKLILVQLTLELKNPKVIQVKSYKGRSNTAVSTLDDNYCVDEELKLAEEVEKEIKAPGRCSEPELIPARRAQQRQRVEALLKSKDYQAVVEILSSQSIIPVEALCMAKHLAARYDLREEDARKAMRSLKLDFLPYPKKAGATDAQKQEYAEVSEYFLMMKNFAETGRYTDFVLRLTPLTIHLQEALLERMGLPPMQEMKGTKGTEKGKLLEAKLSACVPELLKALNHQLGNSAFHDKYPSVFIYNKMIEAVLNLKDDEASSGARPKLTPKEADCKTLFVLIEKLTDSRNSAAHKLTAALTDANIKRGAGCSCAELVQKLEQAIITLYPACDPSLFGIYEKCENYIRERL